MPIFAILSVLFLSAGAGMTANDLLSIQEASAASVTVEQVVTTDTCDWTC